MQSYKKNQQPCTYINDSKLKLDSQFTKRDIFN